MPAMLDDPTAPVIYRVSGESPYPDPDQPTLPPTIYPRQVTLRDRVTVATLLPFASPEQVPPRLMAYLSEELNHEIEKGDTYPMITTMNVSSFGTYWFQNFGAIMVTGDLDGVADLATMEQSGSDWSKLCLGSFYVKPNYPGRSSHICNGGFLVTDAARNKGVGRLMGECYLEWAPQLGYTYSVFNLVYETNVASCRIWDALGFKRIGRVKGAGDLRSRPDEFIDAIIYGRDLGSEGEDFVSEERFEKIRFYLKHSKYPAGADRAEKSRLRSAATHYKLIPDSEDGEERLMLKDKEVVSDPQRQYEIARRVHVQSHGGINKTTASIAEKYHWVRIKETVSLVIKNCPDCKDSSKAGTGRQDGVGAVGTGNGRKPATASAGAIAAHDPNRDIERLVSFDQTQNIPGLQQRPAIDGVKNAKKNRRPRGSPDDMEMQPDINKQPPRQLSPPQQQQQQQQQPQSQSQQPHQQSPISQPLPSKQQQASQPHQPAQTQQQQQQHTLPPLKADTQPPHFQSQGAMPHSQHLPRLPPQIFGTPHQQQQPQQQQQGHAQHQQQPPLPQQAQAPTPQPAPIAQMHSLRPYDDMPLDPQIMSYNPHALPQPSPIHGSLGPHPGMANPQNAMSDQTAMSGMGHGLAHMDQHGQLQLGMGMGAMTHPDAFDLPNIGPPNQHDGMGMGMGDGGAERMDTTADVVADGELERQLMQAGYGGGHTGT